MVADVGPQAHAPQIVRMVHALLSLEISRQEKRRRFAATRGAQPVLLTTAGLERAEDLEGVEAANGVDHARAGRPARQGGGRQRARRSAIGAGGEISRPVGVVVERTSLDVAGPPGRPRPATLGPDLNRAVHRIGAVQRRGCGSLHDLDRLDLVRVEVIEPRGRLATDPDGVRFRPVLHTDSVDHDDRLVGKRDAGRAANPDARARAGRPSRRQHLHTRRAGIEKVGKVRGQRFLVDL